MFSRLRGCHLFVTILTVSAIANAADLKEARVTKIIRDVKLLPNAAPARPAAVDDEVRNGTAVRTGIESRTELKFTDETLARLGANTIFSFNEGTRNLELTDGAMLLRVPKNAGGAKINTAAVTAAITGTTIMLEFHKNSYIKFIVLEGTGRGNAKGMLEELKRQGYHGYLSIEYEYGNLQHLETNLPKCHPHKALRRKKFVSLPPNPQGPRETIPSGETRSSGAPRVSTKQIEN